MKIISFIDQDQVIRKILKHCGLWKDPQPRAPPVEITGPTIPEKCPLDYAFFEKTCICLSFHVYRKAIAVVFP